MAQAPSEKHLEDYLWNHPEALGMIGIPPQYGEDEPWYDFALRQIVVPSGIIDLVGIACGHHLVVAELKKGRITTDAFAQLLRYMNDIKQLTQITVLEALRGHYEHFNGEWRVTDYLENKILQGVLVGSAIEDNLLIACQACSIDAFTYSYHNGVYEFKRAGRASTDRDSFDIFDLQSAPLGTLIRAIADKQIEIETDDIFSTFSAVEAAEQYINDYEGGAA